MVEIKYMAYLRHAGFRNRSFSTDMLFLREMLKNKVSTLKGFKSPSGLKQRIQSRYQTYAKVL